MEPGKGCGGIVFAGLTVYFSGGAGSSALIRLSSTAEKESPFDEAKETSGCVSMI
jgi:hypothetical protein